MIELKNLTFSYQKGRKLFDNLELTLKPGNIYGLLGRNGAGKSTLLKQICGMLYPDAGTCNVMGFDSRDRIPEMLQDIYLVPEEFELPEISMTRYAKINAVFYPAFDFELLNKLTNEFELPAERKLSQLSYGQKKKFILSFGLASKAKVMILDEPSNGLDIPSKSQFRKIIASCIDEERIFIISTHQVRDLENLLDTIVILEKGKILFNRNVSEITERISFEHDLSAYPESEILYSEEIAGKKSGMVKNNAGAETRIDLELLFNGVIKNSSLINSNFKNL